MTRMPVRAPRVPAPESRNPSHEPRPAELQRAAPTRSQDSKRTRLGRGKDAVSKTQSHTQPSPRPSPTLHPRPPVLRFSFSPTTTPPGALTFLAPAPPAITIPRLTAPSPKEIFPMQPKDVLKLIKDQGVQFIDLR